MPRSPALTRSVRGRRAGPPAECSGPWEYLAFRAPHNIVQVAERILDITADPGPSERGEELDGRRAWLGLDRFDWAELNRSLAAARPGGAA